MKKIISLSTGFWVSQLVRALAHHGVFDPISREAKSAKEIAAFCDIHEEQCARALRAAEGLGLVVIEGSNFRSSDLGLLLTKNHPSGMRNIVLFESSEVHTRLWQNYDYTLKTGQPSCKVTFPDFPSNNYFHAFTEVPGHSQIFEGAMKGYASAEWRQLDQSGVDFSSYHTVVDVGAGDGFLLEQILRKYPKLNGIFFEQPPVCETHKQSSDLIGRYTLVGGDFFKSVPKGDAYLLKHILHDWNDELCLKILNSIKMAIGGDKKGKIYVAEMIVKSTPGLQFAKLYDLNIAVAAGGRERTGEQIVDLLGKAGFKVDHVHPTLSDMSIVEASLK